MRYWIFDKDDTPQRFPLQKLVRLVRDVYGRNRETCDVTKARGYGEVIRGWDIALESQDRLTVDIDLLTRLSHGVDEWFYDFEGRIDDARFGLHDSTALFLEASPESAAAVLREFHDVRPDAS